jgi:hypothetical protein
VPTMHQSRPARRECPDLFQFDPVELEVPPRCEITAVRSISEQIQLVSYLGSNAFGGVVGKRLI